MVATPIGNLDDMSARATEVLRQATTIAAEDTRVSRALLEHVGARARPIAAHQHNEQRTAATIVRRLEAGERVALISDAGTPAISDPGAAIVEAAHRAGARVVPVPGPSAVVTLLSAAGFQSSGFVFDGFLPRSTKAVAERLRQLVRVGDTLGASVVVFEAPHRIAQTLAALPQACGEARTVAVGRELTKQFEEVHRCLARDATAWLGARPERKRGEFVIAIAPEVQRVAAVAGDPDEPTGLRGAPTLRDLLTRLLKDLPASAAVRLAHELTGAPRDALYAMAVSLKSDAPLSARP